MSRARPFLDTNVLLYLLSGDAVKADRAEALVAEGGHISVQVLNEFAAVATRKLGLTWAEVRDVLDTVRRVCTVEPVTVATHDRAVELADRYGLNIYDALIAAAALVAGCDRLLSEDLHAGLRIDRRLRVVNPF